MFSNISALKEHGELNVFLHNISYIKRKLISIQFHTDNQLYQLDLMID